MREQVTTVTYEFSTRNGLEVRFHNSGRANLPWLHRSGFRAPKNVNLTRIPRIARLGTAIASGYVIENRVGYYRASQARILGRDMHTITVQSDVYPDI